jgi:hypothetical protein
VSFIVGTVDGGDGGIGNVNVGVDPDNVNNFK